MHKTFKYTQICRKMRKAWFYQNRKEKVFITILYAKAFLYASFPCSARFRVCVCVLESWTAVFN